MDDHFSCRPKSTKLPYLRCNWSQHNKQSDAHGFFEFDSKSGIPSPFFFSSFKARANNFIGTKLYYNID